jgi:hypothetical protein
MASNRTELYRASMMTHRLGYALFEPHPFSRLRPGMLGFLDNEYHRWHPLLDLTDAKAIQAAGLPPIQSQVQSEPELSTWGPQTASTVDGEKINIKAEADASSLGLPADFGAAYEYTSNKGFGAILMCDDKVVAEGFDLRSPFLTWMKQNSKPLLSKFPDIKSNGLCAVTWTYSSKDIYINAWEEASNKVMIGFKAGATGAGHINTDASWYRAHSSGGWKSWNDQKRVIFFTGVKIKFGPFGIKEEIESQWRGVDNNYVVEGLEGGSFCEAEVEFIGDDYQKIKDDEMEESEED